MTLVVGIDIGGTKVLAVEADADGRVVGTARRETPGRLVDARLVEDALTAALEDVAAGRHVDAVGVAAAGFVDAPGERVRFAPHLPWRDDRVRARLAERWGTPVALDNDANCVARAESAYGAARGAASALVITLGTGIGGALVLDGALLRGHNGMAGESGTCRSCRTDSPASAVGAAAGSSTAAATSWCASRVPGSAGHRRSSTSCATATRPA